MAKLTANGAHKVAEWRRDRPSDIWQASDGTPAHGYVDSVVTDVLALRSDGALLARVIYPRETEPSYNGRPPRTHRDASGYRVVARIKATFRTPEAMLSVASRYAERRGYVRA